jgi:chorismate mutase
MDPILAAHRRSIANIDAALVHVMAQRVRITLAVGRYKAKIRLPAAAPDREFIQIARLRWLVDDAGLDPDFTEAFIRFIITELIRHRETIGGERQTGARR